MERGKDRVVNYRTVHFIYQKDYFWSYRSLRDRMESDSLRLQGASYSDFLEKNTIWSSDTSTAIIDRGDLEYNDAKEFKKALEYAKSKYEIVFQTELFIKRPLFWQVKPSLTNRHSNGFESIEILLLEVEKLIERYEVIKNQLDSEFFSREIEFSPEHKQAGLQILHYFQETLNQKYPADDVTVRIGQKGNLVTMEVETPDGNTEKYEEALEDYGLVVTGKKDIADYLEDPVDQMALKNQLNLASVQLENQRNLIEMKNQVIELQAQTIKRDNLTIESLTARIEQFTTSYTHLAEQLAEIAKVSTNHDPVEHFKLLDAVLSVKGEAALASELDGIKKDNPDLYRWLQTQATDITNKTIVGTASKLLIEFFKGYFG